MVVERSGAGSLTLREREVANLLIEGLTYKEIAAELSISIHTVNAHVTSIRRKTGVSSIRLLARALRAQEVADVNRDSSR